LGIGGHVEVNDLSPVMTEHDEDVQGAESDRRNGKEIAGSDVGNMIGKECSPRLRRRFPRADQVLGHGPFRDFVPQQEQFREDSRCGPGRGRWSSEIRWPDSGPFTRETATCRCSIKR